VGTAKAAEVTQYLDGLVQGELRPLLFRPVWLWDLDSTIRDTTQRQWIIPEIKSGNASWADYSMLCAADAPIEGPIALMREAVDVSHIGVTGSNECARNLTSIWLDKNEVPLSAVIMRPDDYPLPNGKWKVMVIRALLRVNADIRLFFEDWDVVAVYIREQTGIPVVGINPFYPTEKESPGDGVSGAVLCTRRSRARSTMCLTVPSAVPACPGGQLLPWRIVAGLGLRQGSGVTAESAMRA
jgi:hypothetical protein